MKNFVLDVNFIVRCFYPAFLFLHAVDIYAQLIYPIQGTFQNKSAQGMAIYGDTAYLMNDGGLCRVLDLKKGSIVRHFNLGSSAKGNHINNACFGNVDSKSVELPLLYLSECMGKGRCFVEQLVGDSSRLVQTIEAMKNDKNYRMTNWVVDNDNGYLYGVTRNSKELLDSAWNVTCHIVKYRRPELDEGFNVLLTEKDIIDQFEVIYPNILQGCKIRGGKLYLVTGLQQTLSDRKDAQRAILVIDLKKKKIIYSFDMTNITTNEPEDIDYYRGKWLLYCGCEGGIYELKLKK